MDFKEHLKKYLSEKEIDLLIKSFDEPEQKGLLLNTSKMSVEAFKKMFPNVLPHPVIPNAFLYNKNDYDFGKHILHELGAYYIQDPSAMLVSYLLSPKENDLVLDMCAAPGGKSVGAALLMNNKGCLVSNDTSYPRLSALFSNIERMGISNVIVTSNDFSKNYQKFNETFDKIILDAPCSGSGMIRKLDEMKDDWSINKVLKFASIQKELILAAYSMLKKGGYLIYSTCSYSYEEDEEVIKYLLENSNAKLIKIPTIPGEYRYKERSEAIHLLSSHFLGEGHFICLIHKEGESKTSKFTPYEMSKSNLSKGGKKEELIYKVPTSLAKEMEKYIIRPGLLYGTKINNKIVPSHAYSHTLSNNENMFEVSEEEAKRLFLGESIDISLLKLKDGYYYPSYLNIPICVVHIVNGKLKNLLPKGLRKRFI